MISASPSHVFLRFVIDLLHACYVLSINSTILISLTAKFLSLESSDLLSYIICI